MPSTDDRRGESGSEGSDGDYHDDEHHHRTSTSGAVPLVSPPPFEPPPVPGRGPMDVDGDEGDEIEEVILGGPLGPMYSDRRPPEPPEPELESDALPPLPGSPGPLQGAEVDGDDLGAGPEPAKPRPAKAARKKAVRKKPVRKNPPEELPVDGPPVGDRPARKRAAKKRAVSKKAARRRPQRRADDADGPATLGPAETAAKSAGFEWRPWMTYTGAGLIGLIILVLLLIAVGGGGDGGETRSSDDAEPAVDEATAAEPEPVDDGADEAGADAQEPDEVAADATDEPAGDDGTGTDPTNGDSDSIDDPAADPAGSPEPASLTVQDRDGDTFDCATGELLDRPGIDIRSMTAHRDGDRVRVSIVPDMDPSEVFQDVFSMAFTVDLVAMMPKTYMREHHDGGDRAGELDVETNEVVPGTEQDVTVSSTEVFVDVPIDPFDPPLLAIGRSFQTPTEGVAKGCDVAVVTIAPFADVSGGPGSCVPNHIACVNDDRFAVQGSEGEVQLDFDATADGSGASAATADGGEVFVGLVPGCGVNDQWWTVVSFTGSGIFSLTIEDTLTGDIFTSTNPVEGDNPALDSTAFSCP